MTDLAAMIKLVKPIAYMLEELPHQQRRMLLCSLLAQEICTLPASARWDALADVMTGFPTILQSTETGMREALAANARLGE